jgi:hypothetical protein
MKNIPYIEETMSVLNGRWTTGRVDLFPAGRAEAIQRFIKSHATLLFKSLQ